MTMDMSDLRVAAGLPAINAAGRSHVNVEDGGGRESNCRWLPDNTGGRQESELINDL